MSQRLFHICTIIAEGEEDFNTISEYLKNYPVLIVNSFQEDTVFDTPTLMIGWEFVKHRFPHQNILDKDITNKLFWSFSKKEEEKNFLMLIENFFIASLKEWLPNNFKLYDSYLNKQTLHSYFLENLNSDKKTFIYFHEGALYVNNDNNNYIINIKSLASSQSDFKKILSQIINEFNMFAFSFNNIGNYIDVESIGNVVTLDNLRWIKLGVETEDSYFNQIPNFKIEKYIPFLMSKINPIELSEKELKFFNRMCQRDKITHWLSNREVAFVYDFNKNLNFKIRKDFKLAKINYSNKRTITGRISGKDSYNVQTLEKHNEDRKNIISRFKNGQILVLDYVSFETKIALYLTDDEKYIQENCNEDLHYKTAKELYPNEDITLEKRMFSKIINHALLYGASEDTLLTKLAEHFSNPEQQLYKIKMLLKPIIDKAAEIKQLYKVQGFLNSPWGSIIKGDKYYAGFSHYIQTYASEILVDKLFEVQDFIKNFKTEFIFQVHDSLVFDLHPDEFFLIEKLVNILAIHKEMSFGVIPSIGSNYKDVVEIKLKKEC